MGCDTGVMKEGGVWEIWGDEGWICAWGTGCVWVDVQARDDAGGGDILVSGPACRRALGYVELVVAVFLREGCATWAESNWS